MSLPVLYFKQSRKPSPVWRSTNHFCILTIFHIRFLDEFKHEWAIKGVCVIKRETQFWNQRFCHKRKNAIIARVFKLHSSPLIVFWNPIGWSTIPECSSLRVNAHFHDCSDCCSSTLLVARFWVFSTTRPGAHDWASIVNQPSWSSTWVSRSLRG